MNDASRLNIYCNAYRYLLNDVTFDYFTSGHTIDSDDDTFHEGKSDLESDIEDLTKLTAATVGVGMATTGVGHDDTEADNEIGEGSNNISVYVCSLFVRKRNM